MRPSSPNFAARYIHLSSFSLQNSSNASPHTGHSVCSSSDGTHASSCASSAPASATAAADGRDDSNRLRDVESSTLVAAAPRAVVAHSLAGGYHCRAAGRSKRNLSRRLIAKCQSACSRDSNPADAKRRPHSPHWPEQKKKTKKKQKQKRNTQTNKKKKKRDKVRENSDDGRGRTRTQKTRF